jgi:hypothetical protein
VDVTLFPLWGLEPPVELLGADGSWRAVDRETALDPAAERLVLRVHVRNLWADTDKAAPAAEKVLRELLAPRHVQSAEAFRFFEPKVWWPLRAFLKVTLEGLGEKRVSEPALLTQQHYESKEASPVRLILDRTALTGVARILGRPVKLGDLRLQFELDVYSRLETEVVEARLEALRTSLVHFPEELRSRSGREVAWAIVPESGEAQRNIVLRQVLNEKVAVTLAVREGEDVSLAGVVELLLGHVSKQLH